jgi:hypothetical protein
MVRIRFLTRSGLIAEYATQKVPPSQMPSSVIASMLWLRQMNSTHSFK